MRRILLSLASIWVGTVTVAFALVLVFGSFFSIFTFLFGFIFAMLLGLALSAPHFLASPKTSGPVNLWIPGTDMPAIAWVFRALSATGWWVLRGVWFLIHRGRAQQSMTKTIPPA
jgi:hypothetical protein